MQGRRTRMSALLACWRTRMSALLYNPFMAVTETQDLQSARYLAEACEQIQSELAKVIVGQSGVIEEVLIAVFARGHCIMQGVPGPAKTQAALLQAMQERQVTAGSHTFDLPDPFFVLATQNPIEQEGTYPLPEAQLDR